LLPPFAINVAIPLVTMDISLGTTGFWPGSHIALPDLKLNDQDMISPIMPTGSLALWDFRTKHCGLANQGDRVRPLLYATACRPFWADHGNFKRGRDLKLLVDPETLESFDKPNRKKFARAQLFSAGARPWQLPDS
jgi:ectoine hydroxylase-related dioxygenase (phytanoyl-CoA dioxygenase family)